MRYLDLFFRFFKIALFTLGGGYAILPVMRDHFVVRHELLKEEEFQEYLALVQGLPGSLAVNCATLIGYRLYGFAGAVVGVLGSILPSFLVITGLSIGFSRIGEQEMVMRFFKGVRPAVVALILYFAIGMMKRTQWNPIKGTVLVVCLVLFMALRINPILLILMGVTAGLGYSFWLSRGRLS